MSLLRATLFPTNFNITVFIHSFNPFFPLTNQSFQEFTSNFLFPVLLSHQPHFLDTYQKFHYCYLSALPVCLDLMAPSSTTYPVGLKLKLAVTLVCIFCLTFPLPNSVAQGLPYSRNGESWQKRKMVLGSRPPGCVNKCFSCRPCMATLVVPSHQKKTSTYKKLSHHGDDDGDGYYLLSWKCRCGDKLFQP